MQNDYDSYNPPPPDFVLAIKSYLESLRKLRSLNTLTNQQISDEEFIENIKHTIQNRVWLENHSLMLRKAIIENESILEEARRHADEILKFAQENPIVMTTGIYQKEFDLIEAERKKTLQEINNKIKELETIIKVLKDRYQTLSEEIAELENEIDKIDERCFQAALHIFNLPKNLDESTEINLARIIVLQPYLSNEKSSTIKINHAQVIENYQQEISKQPKGIDKSKIEDALKYAVKKQVNLDKYFEDNFTHIPKGKRSKIYNEMINEMYNEIDGAFESYQDLKNIAIITRESEQRDHVKDRISQAEKEREIVSQCLYGYEEMLKIVKKEESYLLMQSIGRMTVEAAKFQHTHNEKETTIIPAQTKNKKEKILEPHIEQSSVFSSSFVISPTVSSLPPNNETKVHEVEKAVLSSPSITAKNESTIQVDEDNHLNEKDKNINFDASTKIEEKKQERSKDLESFSGEISQQRIPPKVIENAKTTTAILQEAQPVQNKKHARTKKPIPGQTFDSVRELAISSEVPSQSPTEIEKALSSSLSITAKNESSIRLDRDTHPDGENKKAHSDTPAKIEEKKQEHSTGLNHLSLFSVATSQQRIPPKVISDTKTITAILKEAQPVQNTKPIRAKKPIPGQSLDSVRKIEPVAEKSEELKTTQVEADTPTLKRKI